MSIARRISKIAAAMPTPAPERAMREEWLLFGYLVRHSVLQTDRLPALRDQLSARVEEFELRIRKNAATPITDQLLGHIEYVEDVWVASGRKLPFIPPVIGSWSDDWFVADLTAKRLAIRRHSAVVALIGDTISSPWGYRP